MQSYKDLLLALESILTPLSDSDKREYLILPPSTKKSIGGYYPYDHFKSTNNNSPFGKEQNYDPDDWRPY